MQFYRKALFIDRNLKDIFLETWDFLKPQLGPLSLIWAVFFIPTNVFILMRSGDMVRHLNSGSPLVLPVMILLSLLGTVPNIAAVLLLAQGGCEDYNALVADAFKKLPSYITTYFMVIIRLLPAGLLGGIAVVLFFMSVGDSAWTGDAGNLVYVSIPLMLLPMLLAYMRYFSAISFYLMRGERNFRALLSSRILFRFNRKKVFLAFAVCSLLPMAVNTAMIFLVDSEIFHVIFGFIIGYYLFLSSPFYAALLINLREDDFSTLPAEVQTASEPEKNAEDHD